MHAARPQSPPGPPPRTLVEAIRQTIRRLHYSPRTEDAYIQWTRAFIAYHRGRHPRALGADEITAFLNHLAVDRRVSASTQNQALCAQLANLERARRPHHLPAVLSPREVVALLDRLEPPFRLLAELLYGSGLRLLEALAIRIKDVDIERRQIMVRRGKGQHDRAALLPARMRDGLQAQMAVVAERHRAECAAGRGRVDLPDALRRHPGRLHRHPGRFRSKTPTSAGILVVSPKSFRLRPRSWLLPRQLADFDRDPGSFPDNLPTSIAILAPSPTT